MKNISILVIDDEPNNFEVIETILIKEPYNIYYASSGQDALSGLDAFAPDLILLDLAMPGMDGLEVCQRIKLMRKWKSVPIMMVTASTGNNILSECLSAGADDFIRKPLDPLELKARVESMLRIKKQFDRIESLTRLQQKNITSLESEIGDLGCDLAVGFATELNEPLSKIVDRLTKLEENINTLDRRKIIRLVKSAKRSAEGLERLTNKIWIYLELFLERKQFYDGESCEIRSIFRQVINVRNQLSEIENNIALNMNISKIAISDRDCELIVKELIDYSLKLAKPELQIEIHGRSSQDNKFHLWMSNFPSASFSEESLQKDNGEDFEETELGLSLKIIKKVVDIYEGLFSIQTITDRSSSESEERTLIYLTLPLAASE